MTAPVLPRYCPQCRAELALRVAEEDGGPKERLRCPNCDYVHWNNPTPVLAAVIECVDRDGAVLLARNAAWPGRFFGLVAGFLEANVELALEHPVLGAGFRDYLKKLEL